ncbi:unnamed protein product [Fructobacillus fructosus]|uniref:helix-turn-helix transcriptional regulator n=1 Tax=Fructobacillus fructosus TaxID=1631 RepID=UPI0002195730|nr:helix-turn-helix transcriptional regulator [Fructobacillus fructosus]GAP01979.1 hypothetical protein FFRU_210020 [Fructobacillus fructosus]CAK1247350.1 unnamed protein product [Fructobacillus fructosus]
MNNNLRKIMGFYGFSNISLSKKAKVSRGTITDILNGSNPNKETMEKITKAIGNGLTVNDIFFAKDVILVVQNEKVIS